MHRCYDDRQWLLDDSQWPESGVISEWFCIKPTGDRRQPQAQAAANTVDSDTDRRSSSAVSAPLPPPSSAGASDVAAGSSLVATMSSSSLPAAAAGTRPTTRQQAPVTVETEMRVLYNSNGLSTDDVVV